MQAQLLYARVIPNVRQIQNAIYLVQAKVFVVHQLQHRLQQLYQEPLPLCQHAQAVFKPVLAASMVDAI